MDGESARPTVWSEDDKAQYYLSFLRDGAAEEKIAARVGLARIFERRGMLDEAAELYERNVLAGARTEMVYERLAAIYQRQGRVDLAQATLRRGREICPSSGQTTSAGRPSPTPAGRSGAPRWPAASTRQVAAGLIAGVCLVGVLSLLAGPAGGADQAGTLSPSHAEETDRLSASDPAWLAEVAQPGAGTTSAFWTGLLDHPDIQPDIWPDALVALGSAAADLVDTLEPSGSDAEAFNPPRTSGTDVFVVAHVGRAGLSLRPSPAAEQPTRVWSEGTGLLGLGERIDAAGRSWMKVRDPDGSEGWAAAEFLVARPRASARMRAAGQSGDLAELAEPQSLTPNQLTDGATLTRHEAFAACAPAAAVAFARALGSNPTLDETVELARRVGWTAWDGMAGPRSQVDLLARMGIASRLDDADGGIDWEKVVGDVEAGKPVIVAAVGHYFVAEGFDPASGRLDFGNSATVLRAAQGKRWFAPDELGSLGMGRALSTIHLAAAPSLGDANPSAGDGGGFDRGGTFN